MDLNNVNIISCPRIGLTSSDVKTMLGRIFNYLYKDDTIYLNRKYEVFKQALS